MKFLTGFLVRKMHKRMLPVVLSICLFVMILPISTGVSAAESIITDYQPTIHEVIDESGFKHPGVGLTKDILEDLRTQVRAQKEPWNTYFNGMLMSYAAAKNVGSSNQGAEPTQPASDAFNSQGFNGRFIDDGLKAYTQALLYVITGDEVYRANAMKIIRVWSNMDPAKYAYFNDAHIHTGIPLNRMVTAAEILRYTSTQSEELEWTEQDTIKFTNNLITPVIETFNYTNNRFMNQHLYPLLGAISGYIFTGNLERYNEGVEWFTVNKTAVDQGQNGAIKQLFRLVDTNILTGEKVDPPVVQHVEMGRDQAHGAGDVTNAEILSRLLLAQGTKVDPVKGTVSTAPDAVGPYEFLDNRLLKAADYFARFMIGYDTPWIPVAAHTDADGNPTIIYKELSEQYRGRIGGNVYDLYYYYKYEAGVNVEEEAPYFAEMFAMRHPFHWESRDGGGDYWLYIPKEAEAEGTQNLPKTVTNPALREFEDRYTKQGGNSVTLQEGDTSFVRINATEEGSKIALVATEIGKRMIGFRVRTNGTAKLEMSYGINETLTLPDTKGQWRYITLTTGVGNLAYFTVKGAGTVVDIDHINVQAAEQLTPPVFNAGDADLNLFTYVGSEAEVQYDFSATDPSETDVVVYQIDNMPDGVAFDESTGAFSWKPTQAGTYSFVVAATDGTSFATRDVTVTVADDRQTAVDAAIVPYDGNESYITSTLDRYKEVYADVMNAISSVTDDVFLQKLTDLERAVSGLRLLTPLLKDGSMNYLNMFVTSTFGNQIAPLLDNYTGSFAGYYLAQNLSYYMDFGPDYKVSANAFGLQVRASFPERIGGVAAFGSNDMETWTRLTPGMTTVTEDMQRLDVQNELKSEQFRFLKLEMIKPSSSMFEMSEFRIFGHRHETINKLEGVSIHSDQSLKNRVVPGDTVKLSFKSTETIQDVDVAIQGQAADVSTVDNLNWTATLVVDDSVQAGTVKFKINYKTADGMDADETIFTSDGSALFIADQTGYVNVLEIANLFDSSGRSPEGLLNEAGKLFDGDLGSITDFRLNGSGYGAYLAFDFKEGGQAKLSRVEVISRQDGYASRINGTVVQGSNDNVTWTTISNAAWNTSAWQTLAINSTEPYRYIRITNGNNWYGNMAELRLYGDVKIMSKIDSVSIDSDQSVQKRIVPGDTVKLSFQSTEEINDVNVNIHGQAATVSTADNINWTAEAVMDGDASPGNVSFSINYKTAEGVDGPEKTTTTDNSSLYIADETGLIRGVLEIANLYDSSGRTPEGLLNEASKLFDGNAGSITDFRLNGSGYGGYITFDFKEGGKALLSKVEVLSRQDGYASRINGTVVQGSNDNATWTTISDAAKNTSAWQTLAINNMEPYRYIRITNGNNWFGNMAELRLYGDVKVLAKLDSVNMSSDKSIRNRIVPGDTVKLSFMSTEEINDVKVDIQGQAATVSTADNINWTAEAVIVSDAIPGAVSFSINYKTIDGYVAPEKTSTTDGSKLYIPDETGLIRNVLEIADLYDSNGRTQSTLLNVAGALFDGNAGSITDFRLNGSGSGGYITFDFKAGNQAVLTKVELLARQDNYYTRIKGAVVLGSNDNTTWKAISPEAASTPEWQTLSITSTEPYRYIRIYNWSNWFGNMAELRLYGDVSAADLTPPDAATFDADITAPTSGDVTVTIIYPDDAAVQEYKLGEDGDWTAYTDPVVFFDNGTVFARGTDEAGNVSDVSSYEVSNIDKLAPVSIASVGPDVPDGNNGWYTSNVTVSLDAADDLSGVAIIEYQVNNGSWMVYTGSIPAFGDGVYTVNYRSTDLAGNVEETQTIEFKVDGAAPELTVELDNTTIWPPNHKLVTITAAVNGSDNLSGIESIVLTSITSNEPDQGTYSDDLPNDIQDAEFGTLDTSFSLRAERSDEGTGRIYTITYTITDVAGNTAEVSVTVTVPRNQSGSN